ncbi:MAG TPA: sugar-binding protein, partial [Armatimonadota bacterium]|nr:sugar-binding protein [Armatimonadota bacterium]
MRHYYLAIVLLLAGLAATAETPPLDRIMAHTVWTTTALYFGLRVDDPLIVGNQTAPMSQPWLDDAIAVYLDLDPTNGDLLDRDCVRVIVSAAGGVSVQRGDKGDWRDDPSWFQPGERGTIRLARRVNGTLNDNTKPDTGYVVEMALSWQLLGVVPPFRRSARDPLPAIGYAVACYAQGETRAVSCWPEGVMEEDLNHPARWGQLQFLQNAQPLPTTERLANAPLVMLDPFIDGEVRATEWVMAGVVSYRRRPGHGVAPSAPGRQPVSLTAVWYSLDPEGASPAHHPLEPLPPWVTPAMPLYHQPQVKAIRQAGIDALAVALPGAPSADTRARLLALVQALSAYDAASTAAYFYDVPPIVPVLDLSAETADPARLAATLEAAATEAFRAIPPRYRLTLPSPDGGACYPLIVVAPPNPGPLAALPLAAAGERLRAAWGAPIGWLLDAAWTGDAVPPGVLARCAWDPSAGVQVGAGPLRTALIAPGVGARQGFLSRSGGDTYANGWVKVTGAQPDLLLIRSWNEFARGTEIAASRQYGQQYLDATRLALMRLAEGRDFGLTVLGHTLPPVLRAGAAYPVEVLIKNGSLQKVVSQHGFRVHYRVTRDDVTVLSGLATDKLALFDRATSRIGLTLPTVAARRPLAAGAYRLHLDFSRNKIAFLTAPLLTERVGTLTIPFTVAGDAPAAQLLETAIPGALGPAQRTPVGLAVRNAGADAWRKNAVTLR